MLEELLAEMVFVAEAEVVCNLLYAHFFKSVEIRHSLGDLEVEHILVYSLSKGGLEFGLCRFYGDVHHIGKLGV